MFVAGVVSVSLRRIGYEATEFEIRVEPGDNLFGAHMDGAIVELDEVRIVGGRTIYGRFADFEHRRARHDASSVITRSDIEHRHPLRLSQMLRTMSGIRLADSSGNMVGRLHARIEAGSHTRARHCHDGMRAAHGGRRKCAAAAY